MTEKTIEEMAHDYVVAKLKSGDSVGSIDARDLGELACTIKDEAKRKQKEIDRDNQRRSW